MKITIIGAGNMGGAIASGLLEKRFLRAEELTIVDPFNREFEKRGAVVCEKIENSVLDSDLVIVAVKPWIAKEVLIDLARVIGGKRISVGSVVAGLSIAEMSEILSEQPLFRIMPNTAVRVGEGMTFVSEARANDAELRLVTSMFETVGRVMVVDENQMTACMALASCGIAYALRYVRAAMEGGVELGISANSSQQIVSQTLRGAAALLSDGSHPEVEIDKVTTPGGITIKGLNAMEQCGFTNAVIQGLKASK